MEGERADRGLLRPVHRALTEPILLGGAPRSLAIVNGTLAGAIGLGLRLDRRPRIWAIGHALSVWAARATRSSSTWPAATSATRHGCSHDELARISWATRPISPTSCPGPRWSARASFSTRTAAFSAPPVFAAGPRQRHAGRAGRHDGRLNNALPVSARAGRSSSKRSAPALDYPEATFPIPSRRWSIRAPRTVPRRRRAFRERYFLTLLWMPPAEDAARAETWLYEGRSGTGVDPWELLQGFTDRSDRVLNLVEGFVPEVCWLDDARR
jgi:type IV secretory pathway TrbD component